jgi:hypothetical protein
MTSSRSLTAALIFSFSVFTSSLTGELLTALTTALRIEKVGELTNGFFAHKIEIPVLLGKVAALFFRLSGPHTRERLEISPDLSLLRRSDLGIVNFFHKEKQ